MMDVDNFKDVNDTYGHAAGDEVLKTLVAHSIDILRGTDLFGRVGGEEFAVILPETDAETALWVGERMREELARVRVDAGDAQISFTVSIGLAVLESRKETLETIISRADAALYRSQGSRPQPTGHGLKSGGCCIRG